MLDQMMSRHPLQGARDDRPWTDCGDGPSLTSGRFGDLGRAIGHAGGSPFRVNAVCHFPGPCQPVTVACFTDGADEGLAEFAALRCAAGVCPESRLSVQPARSDPKLAPDPGGGGPPCRCPGPGLMRPERRVIGKALVDPPDQRVIRLRDLEGQAAGFGPGQADMFGKVAADSVSLGLRGADRSANIRIS